MPAVREPDQFGPHRLVLLWQVTAVAGVLLFTAHTLLRDRLGFDDAFDRWLYNALILLGVAACAVRAARIPTERAVWLAFTVGAATWAVGELLFDFAYDASPPYPSVADAFYLGFYPACYVGLLLLLRARGSRFNRSLWLDGAMAAAACAAFGAAVVFEVVLDSTHGSAGVIVTNLAYPLGDMLLLSTVVGIFVLSGWRLDRTWVLLGAGLTVSALADSIFLYQTSTGSYVEGTVLDTLWPASILLLCAAAWERPRRVAIALEGRPLLGTPLACGLVGLAVLVYDHFRPLNLLAVGLAGVTILLVVVRTAMTFRENTRVLELMRHHAVTDPLTGLGNRRRLVLELEEALVAGAGSEPRLLAMFDLDGFKRYNDMFGHPAGDALLARLAENLARDAAPGTSYRLGGDEFCVLATVSAAKTGAFLDLTANALGEEGEGFKVTSSFGAVFLPDEAISPREALRLVDQRLYAQKRERAERGLPHELLLQALYEREPELRLHVQSVEEMACAVGSALALSPDQLEELRLGARLHDVGKLAIPDAVLQKPGPLDLSEWAFVKEHTVIGERILSASPALREIGRVVRATHERWNGSGYPDGLAGEQIPLAARIIAVCDAFSAMTSERPYRALVNSESALAELRRCAGTQFDPEVVAVFCARAELASQDGWGEPQAVRVA